MASSSPSSSRHVLINSTNIEAKAHDEFSPRKRLQANVNESSKKRVKLEVNEDRNVACSSDESDSGGEDVVNTTHRANARKRTIFGMRSDAILHGDTYISRQLRISTRPILQSFVSSYKADIFKLYSMESNSFLSIPYSCAYSFGAKSGRKPLLAVATEPGTVHILDTSKRQDWDCEPQRQVIQPHRNGIFDIKWSSDDSLLATASGDQSTRVTSLMSSTPLYTLIGQTGTPKCVAWDPSRQSDILCTGARDGSICMWDLRVGECRGKTSVGSQIQGGHSSIAPVISISSPHEPGGAPARTKSRKGKVPIVSTRSTTSVIYPDGKPHCLVNSNAVDGILRMWDLRLPIEHSSHPNTPKPLPKPIYTSSTDPTTLGGTQRARGITSLAAGSGPSAGLLYALGTDSRIHTYSLPSLEPLSGLTPPSSISPDLWGHTHEHARVTSFYVKLAASPCGRWLASGSAGSGRVFLFDVNTSGSNGRAQLGGYAAEQTAVELCGQAAEREIGAVDWAEGMLATCAQNGTVRVWRPDLEVFRRCQEDPEEAKWEWSWCQN